MESSAAAPKVEVDCYENQRFWPAVGWSGSMLPTDRYSWSNRDGKKQLRKSDFPLPNGWCWKIDNSTDEEGWKIVANKSTDKNGWSYAFDFGSTFHPRARGCFVRTRKWLRVRTLGVSTKTSALSVQVVGQALLRSFKTRTLTTGGIFSRKTHKRCFLASEAISWMLAEKYANDEKEACETGQQLVLNQLFRPVNHNRRFHNNKNMFQIMDVTPSSASFYLMTAKDALLRLIQHSGSSSSSSSSNDESVVVQIPDDFLKCLLEGVSKFIVESQAAVLPLYYIVEPIEPLVSLHSYTQEIVRVLQEYVFKEGGESKLAPEVKGRLVDHACNLFGGLALGSTPRNVYGISIALLMLPEILSLRVCAIKIRSQSENEGSSANTDLSPQERDRIDKILRGTQGVLELNAVTACCVGPQIDAENIEMPWLSTALLKGGIEYEEQPSSSSGSSSSSSRRRRPTASYPPHNAKKTYAQLVELVGSLNIQGLRRLRRDAQTERSKAAKERERKVIGAILSSDAKTGIIQRIQRTSRRFTVMKAHGGAEALNSIKRVFAAAIKHSGVIISLGEEITTATEEEEEKKKKKKKASKDLVEIWRLVMQPITAIAKSLKDGEETAVGQYSDIESFFELVIERADFLLKNVASFTTTDAKDATVTIDAAFANTRSVTEFCTKCITEMQEFQRLPKRLEIEKVKGLCRLAGISAAKVSIKTELTYLARAEGNSRQKKSETILKLATMLVVLIQNKCLQEAKGAGPGGGGGGGGGGGVSQAKDLLLGLECPGYLLEQRIIATYLCTLSTLMTAVGTYRFRQGNVPLQVLKAANLVFKKQFIPHILSSNLLDFLVRYLPLGFLCSGSSEEEEEKEDSQPVTKYPDQAPKAVTLAWSSFQSIFKVAVTSSSSASPTTSSSSAVLHHNNCDSSPLLSGEAVKLQTALLGAIAKYLKSLIDSAGFSKLGAAAASDTKEANGEETSGRIDDDDDDDDVRWNLPASLCTIVNARNLWLMRAASGGGSPAKGDDDMIYRSKPGLGEILCAVSQMLHLLLEHIHLDGVLKELGTHKWLLLMLRLLRIPPRYLSGPSSSSSSSSKSLCYPDIVKAVFPFQLCQVLVIKILQTVLPRTLSRKLPDAVARESLNYLKARLGLFTSPPFDTPPKSSSSPQAYTSLLSIERDNGIDSLCKSVESAYGGLVSREQCLHLIGEILASGNGAASVTSEAVSLFRSIGTPISVEVSIDGVSYGALRGYSDTIADFKSFKSSLGAHLEESSLDIATLDVKNGDDPAAWPWANPSIQTIPSKSLALRTIESTSKSSLFYGDREGSMEGNRADGDDVKESSEIIGEAVVASRQSDKSETKGATSTWCSLLNDMICSDLENLSTPNDRGGNGLLDAIFRLEKEESRETKQKLAKKMIEVSGSLAILAGCWLPGADGTRVQVKLPSGVEFGIVHAVRTGGGIAMKLGTDYLSDTKYDVKLDSGSFALNVSLDQIAPASSTPLHVKTLRQAPILNAMWKAATSRIVAGEEEEEEEDDSLETSAKTTTMTTQHDLHLLHRVALGRRALSVIQMFLKLEDGTNFFIDKDFFGTMTTLAFDSDCNSSLSDILFKIHLARTTVKGVYKMHEVQTTAPLTTDGGGKSEKKRSFENRANPIPVARPVSIPIATPLEAKKEETKTDWACEVCTFIQPYSNKSCSMCGAKRSERSQAVVSPPSEQQWKVACTVCTFINDLRAMKSIVKPRCQVCGSFLALPTTINTSSSKATVVAKAKAPPTEVTMIPDDMGKDESFLFELIGFPSSWGEQALTESGGDPLEATAWLLANKDRLVERDFRRWKSFSDGKSPRSTRLPRHMREMTTTSKEASAPKTNPCFRVLNNTWLEPMEVMDDTELDQKHSAVPDASDSESKDDDGKNSSNIVTENFLSAEQISSLKAFGAEIVRGSSKYLVGKWLALEQNLRSLYARQCMIQFLVNLPKRDPALLTKLKNQGGFTKFLRIYLDASKPRLGSKVEIFGLKRAPEFNGVQGVIAAPFSNGRHPVRIANRRRPINIKPINILLIGGFNKDPVFASGALLNSFVEVLTEECQKVKSQVDQSSAMITEKRFKELAPISMQLNSLLLDEILKIYRILYKSGDGTTKALYSKQLFLIRWVIEIFTEVKNRTFSSSGGTKRAGGLNEYFGRIFSSHLVDGIVGLIISSTDQARTDLMQLLASINHTMKKVLRLTLSKGKRDLLARFMFDTHKTQDRTGGNGCFSPFFQALVELNVSVHYMQKVSERTVYTGESAWLHHVLQVAECMMNEGRVTDDIQLNVCNRIGRIDDLTEFLRINNRVFTRECDEELVDLVNRIFIKKGLQPTVSDLKIGTHEMVQFPNLQARNIRQKEMTYRFHVLTTLNQRIHTAIPLINLSVPPGKSSLADGIRSIRSIMFWSTKERLWTTALKETRCRKQEVKVTIDKIKALKCKQQKNVDFYSETVFGQVMSELKHASPRVFRIGRNERAFQVVEVGFNSQDIGGPYRDTIESITRELESPVLPLFAPCMNKIIQTGRNRDVFVPSALVGRSSWQRNRMLEMYEFVGKLMGLAIRTLNYHSFHFSGVVWKPLVYDQVTVSDVTSIDALAFKNSENILNAERKNASADTFNKAMANLRFTVKLRDGNIVELVPGGSKIKVNWDNRKRYCRLLTEYKLNEYKVQCDAIRRGLATVVPYQILSLFTWRDLQDQVCGRIVVDVQLLKSMTRYAGFRKNGRGRINAFSPHIKMFWKMMDERMDNFQRSKLIFFIWGRSRLPVNRQGFERHFTIMAHPASQRSNKNPDQYLPVAHTCFFQLELPEYSNVDRMYEKMMFACTHCTSIDGDTTAAARAAAQAGNTAL